ncbi:cytochrome P450 [Calothrix sp. UHCC 0171]|uniref:cytochrome P450 n=1 Tax=Calothrix sp. UHCC 0171 TaxID=3110245 RepID=UPI002B1F4CFF|nr:cytochrome P450 [Calothrix sp. UHCC 0171]MEA5574315.1 cytochrome P450 [Calothrix sp. UHCC 0171]
MIIIPETIKNKWTREYPPGPKGHFLVGSLWEYTQNPLDFFSNCVAEYGDIVHWKTLGKSSYLINRPDEIEDIFVTQANSFTKINFGYWINLILGKGLVTNEGDFWQRQRRLIQPGFYRQRLNNYGNWMVDYTQKLLENWQGGETRDICQDMQNLSLEIITHFLFGFDSCNQQDDINRIIKLSNECFDLLHQITSQQKQIWFSTHKKQHFYSTLKQLDHTIYKVIQNRRKTVKDFGDLLSMLLHLPENGNHEMDDQQLRDELVTLLIAGRETISMALAWTWYLLSQHPEIEAQLIAELRRVLGGRKPTPEDLPNLPYTNMVFMETLRLYPPDWLLTRKVIKECEIGGYTLPANSNIFISAWLIQRDRRFFENPELFQPQRWNPSFTKQLPKFAYFPFGGGGRACIGKSLAMMEAILVLATIAQQFSLKLIDHTVVEPLATITLRPKSQLKMLLTRR